MSKNLLNTLGLTSDLGVQLTDSEVSTLSKIISESSKNKNISKRAGTTLEPSAVSTQFKPTAKGPQLKPVELFGDYAFMYNKAMETEFTPVVRTSANNALSTALVSLELKASDVIAKSSSIADNSVMEVVKVTPANVNIERTREQFKMLLSMYGCEFISLNKVYRSNKLETKSEVSYGYNFSFNNMSFFTIELPIVNKTGRFTKDGSEYLCTMLAKNVREYALGSDDTLELIHPNTYLIEQILTVFTKDDGSREFYSQETFGNMVKSARRDGTVRTLQNNLSKVLNNAERDYIMNNDNSPIMWIDKHASDYSKHLNSQMVGIFMNYDTMIEVSNLNNGMLFVKGLDLLTGSTSEPAKRCKVAVGYEISYVNNKLCVTKKSENLHELAEIFSEYKFSNAGTLRTSSKRDNSCTITATSNLVTPQKYVKRVTISFNK